MGPTTNERMFRRWCERKKGGRGQGGMVCRGEPRLLNGGRAAWRVVLCSFWRASEVRLGSGPQIVSSGHIVRGARATCGDFGVGNKLVV